MSSINIQQLGVKNWQTTDLVKPENLKLVESLVEEFSLTTNPGDTDMLFLALTEAVKNSSTELQTQYLGIYKKYQVLLKCLSILSLPNKKIEDLDEPLTKDLKFIFTHKIPILNLIMFLIRWDKWSFWVIIARVIRLLRENTEKLGAESQSFTIGKTKLPTIGDWVNDYIIFTEGRPSKMDELSQSAYLTSSESVKKLSPAEKKILQRVIKLFRIFASEDIHTSYFRYPYLYDAETQESETKEADAGAERLNKIKELYQQELKALWLKYAINEGMREISGKDMLLLLRELNISITKPEKLLPILILINKQQIVNKALETNPLLNSLYHQQSMLEFRSRPKNFNPSYLYKLVFKRSGLTEAESAVLMQYLARLNKNLPKAVFVDLKTGQFKWRELTFKGGEIVF